jgi:lipoyl(octanoyl) transferase
MLTIRTVDLGRTAYGECWELQRLAFAARTAGLVPDLLLLTEHDPVYTIGRSGNENHLLAREEELRERGVAVWHNDRGGDITYHGPGQLVGYPILDLGGYYRDLHRYLRDLEQVVIRALQSFGIAAGRIQEYTGVWVGEDKICAIGVKSSRWITMHGFALNIATDLSFFQRIIPCGIFEKGVTSMEVLLGHPVAARDVAAAVVRSFGDVFGARMQPWSPQECLRAITPETVPPAEPVSFHL